MKQRLAIVLSLLAAVGVAWACRYSVRDTGFVDLGDEQYQLVLSGGRIGELAGLYRRLAAASLLDANVSLEVREQSDAVEPSLALVARDGRSLVLARGGELPADAAGATSLLESIALSPLRAEIHEAALKSFAVVILIEGGPAAEVSRAQASIEAAIRQVALLMPAMPKPVDTPPALIRVPAGRLAAERVTLWGLGFEPRPVNEPRVAVVFGRGRRIGDPLAGPLITQTVVQERLVIIGQDCECELDRAWMKGPMLPARWDAGRQEQALQHLGFDPENPLVRAEVSRIVLRGPEPGRVRKLGGASAGLGYSEVVLEDLPADASDEGGSGDAVEPGGPPPGRPATVQAASNPLDRTRDFVWLVVVAGGLALVLGAVLWWRKIRREQG